MCTDKKDEEKRWQDHFRRNVDYCDSIVSELANDLEKKTKCVLISEEGVVELFDSVLQGVEYALEHKLPRGFVVRPIVSKVMHMNNAGERFAPYDLCNIDD